jgi:hypothetical protein
VLWRCAAGGFESELGQLRAERCVDEAVALKTTTNEEKLQTNIKTFCKALLGNTVGTRSWFFRFLGVFCVIYLSLGCAARPPIPLVGVQLRSFVWIFLSSFISQNVSQMQITWRMVQRLYQGKILETFLPPLFVKGAYFGILSIFLSLKC